LKLQHHNQKKQCLGFDSKDLLSN